MIKKDEEKIDEFNSIVDSFCFNAKKANKQLVYLAITPTKKISLDNFLHSSTPAFLPPPPISLP